MIWADGILIDAELTTYPEHAPGSCVYEVLRIGGSCPVFLDEHLDRLFQTLTKIGIHPDFNRNSVILGLSELIKTTKKKEGNIRIQASLGKTGFEAGFIPHHYPGARAYQKGIETISLEVERPRPNLKIWNPEVRKTADQLLNETGGYEVILIDRQGLITEGSRSNLFFANQNTLFTPPLPQVLPGITRQVIFQLAQRHSIHLYEVTIPYLRISDFTGAFISGTSPGILPLARLDHQTYDAGHPLIQRCHELYQEEVKQNQQNTVKKYSQYFIYDE